MTKARIFLSNKSQAVRLPKPVALPSSVKVVEIVKLGNSRLLVPEGQRWATWFEGEGVTDDFMLERDQPIEQQQREEL